MDTWLQTPFPGFRSAHDHSDLSETVHLPGSVEIGTLKDLVWLGLVGREESPGRSRLENLGSTSIFHVV